jgi:hypothetical protein
MDANAISVKPWADGPESRVGAADTTGAVCVAAEPCRFVPGPCQPRLVMNSAIAAYWHAAAAQTQA